jgi:hypothetical protein
MRNYWNAADREQLLTRILTVHPSSPRRWGKMTPHQMICHLADAFRGATGLRPVKPRSYGFERPVKWFALYVPVPWPPNYPTPREIDQARGEGTPPTTFAHDRDALLALMQRFTPETTRGRSHPLWGTMSEWEWGRWGYLHTDHHLRQFSA